MNEGDGTDVQACLVHMGRTGAVGLQSLCDHPQKDAQHHAQHRPSRCMKYRNLLGTESTHWRTGRRGKRGRSGAPPSPPSAAWCMRGRLPGLCRRRLQVVVPTVAAASAGKAMGKDAALKILANALRTKGLGCGGRPGRRTDPRWPTLARSRSARLPFGRAACVGVAWVCRAWAWKWLHEYCTNAQYSAAIVWVL